MNHLCKKFVSLHVAPLARLENACKKPKSESTTFVITTPTISSHESSCLANCRPLKVVPVCCLVLYSLSKKLVFMSVASVKADTHRDRLVVASNAQRLEI